VVIAIGAALASRASDGGHLWAIAQWAKGFEELGYAVVVLERELPPALGPLLRRVLGESVRVCATEDFHAREEEPVALFNFMGYVAPELVGAARSVFVDIDPGYPQMWWELGLADMFEGHDSFVTVGLNVGGEASIPECGKAWVTTVPPVSTTAWPAVAGGRRYTTVATWRNAYGTVTYAGRTYGSRVHEFRQYLGLPRHVDVDLELALRIDPAEVADLEALRANGWPLVDPDHVAGTPTAYRRYVQSSRAELCIAQNMYVGTRSGWLSDRSACYLASGKPVLAQDTGFAEHVGAGEGLIAFATLAELVAGIEAIEADYEHHSAAARSLAVDCFDARKVVARLVSDLDLRSPT